jgi:hypothetical protein
MHALMYLCIHRHVVDCQGSPITGFEMKTLSEGDNRKLSYEFNCLEGVSLTVSEVKKSAVADDGGGNIIFLDRQQVGCGDDAAISKFQLVRDGEAQNYYDYTCVTSDAPPALVECTDHETMRNEGGDGGDKVEFLDRHSVQCPGLKVLTKFQLKTVDGGKPIGKIFYQYRCCSISKLKVWESCAYSFGGLEGNIGEKDGKPLCCPRGCDQCGKDNCVVANSLAKERKGLPWVEKNCCPTSLKELGCNKKGAETPCKCKEQGKCRREAPKYGLTFVATGCCNYSPSTAAMDYWETQLTSTGTRCQKVLFIVTVYAKSIML